jgi:toxin ParE1/3/4
MKVRYTDEALRDLDGILTYIGKRYPAVRGSFENRLRATVRRIAAWPESAPRIEQRASVRVVPLVPYPYRLFFRVTEDVVEILCLHHAARQEPWDTER